jgi:tetratricopeptide (TPR) repeat protein
VAAACLLAVTLAGGIWATLWQAGEAKRAAGDALTQSRRATAARDFMVQLFEANDPNVAQGRTVSARELLDQGAHRVRDAFADTPMLRAEMLVLLGDLYRRMGEPVPAGPLLQEGLDLAEAAGEPGIGLEARFAKGLLDAQVGLPGDALEAFNAVERMLEAAGRAPGDLHGQLVMHTSSALSATGKVADAVEYAEAALARARNDVSLPQESLFFYLSALSATLTTAGQDERAETLLKEALAVQGVDRLAPTRRLPVHSHLASFALARGELETALRESGMALELAERVYLPTNPVRAGLLDGHGIILTHMARFDAAEKAIGEAISILDAQYPDGLDPSVAAACNNMALALDNAERDREAEPYMIRARDLAEKLFGRNDPRYAISVANLGNLYRQMGRHDEADKLLAQGLHLRRELLGEAHPFVGHGLVQVARLRLLQDRAAEALKLADQARDIYAKADYKDPRRLASTDEVRARAMATLGRVSEAAGLFDRAIADASRAGVDNGVEWPRVMAARAELFVEYLPRARPQRSHMRSLRHAGSTAKTIPVRSGWSRSPPRSADRIHEGPGAGANGTHRGGDAVARNDCVLGATSARFPAPVGSGRRLAWMDSGLPGPAMRCAGPASRAAGFRPDSGTTPASPSSSCSVWTPTDPVRCGPRLPALDDGRRQSAPRSGQGVACAGAHHGAGNAPACQLQPQNFVDGVPGLAGPGRAAVRPAPARVAATCIFFIVPSSRRRWRLPCWRPCRCPQAHSRCRRSSISTSPPTPCPGWRDSAPSAAWPGRCPAATPPMAWHGIRACPASTWTWRCSTMASPARQPASPSPRACAWVTAWTCCHPPASRLATAAQPARPPPRASPTAAPTPSATTGAAASRCVPASRPSTR